MTARLGQTSIVGDTQALATLRADKLPVDGHAVCVVRQEAAEELIGLWKVHFKDKDGASLSMFLLDADGSWAPGPPCGSAMDVCQGHLQRCSREEA